MEFTSGYNRTYRELTSRPYFSHVKRVKAQFGGIGLLRLHYLDLRSPSDTLTPFDGLPKVSLGIVGVLTRHADCFTPGELLLAMIGDEMILDVDELSIIIDPVNYSEKPVIQ